MNPKKCPAATTAAVTRPDLAGIPPAHSAAFDSRRYRALCGALVLAFALASLSPAARAQSARPNRPSTIPSETVSTAAAERFVPSVYQRFSEWKAACDRLPSNRSLKLTLPPKGVLPLKNFGAFAEALDAYFKQVQSSSLAQAGAWLGEPPARSHFFNTDGAYFVRPALPFQPFVQRQLVPPGTQILFHGDLHGDIRSLVGWIDWLNQNGYLRDFRIVRPDVYLAFLGDYTDRGLYGIEVLYTILRLKLENPDRVLLVRGNHEDVNLASRYGFLAEARGKYGRDFDAKRVMRLYDFLPVVLYLGCETNVVQCNHGGMEPGFNPGPLLDAADAVQYQLLGPLNQQAFLKKHPDFATGLTSPQRRLMNDALLDFQPATPTTPSIIGFMWNDFSVVRGEPHFDYDPTRAFVYGEKTTRYLLEHVNGSRRRIQAVFRAHQHANILNGMMRRLKVSHGVYRHWQENDSLGLLDAEPPALAAKIEKAEERRLPPYSVWTFNVSPDSVYGEGCDFSFDTFGILTTAKGFENWRLKVVNLTVRK